MRQSTFVGCDPTAKSRHQRESSEQSGARQRAYGKARPVALPNDEIYEYGVATGKYMAATPAHHYVSTKSDYAPGKRLIATITWRNLMLKAVIFQR
jgi:hypothetical protein